jgi:hypothetical protein
MKRMKNRKGVVKLHTNGLVELVEGDGFRVCLDKALNESGVTRSVVEEPNGELSLGGAIDYSTEDGMKIVRAFSKLAKDGWEIM